MRVSTAAREVLFMSNKELELNSSSVPDDGEAGVAAQGVSSPKFFPGQAVTYLVGIDENGDEYYYDVQPVVQPTVH
jgi:hypothetical protein